MKKFKMLNLICDSCELTSKEKLVAQYFIYKSNKKGECYPAVGTIASKCGVSERTIQRATKKLQEEGFISIIKRFFNGKQTSNQYKLNMLLIDEIERIDDIEKEMKQEEVYEDLMDIEIPFINLDEELYFTEKENIFETLIIQTDEYFEVYDIDYDELDSFIVNGEILYDSYDNHIEKINMQENNHEIKILLAFNTFIYYLHLICWFIDVILLQWIVVPAYIFINIVQLIYLNNIIIKIILNKWEKKCIYRRKSFLYLGVSL